MYFALTRWPDLDRLIWTAVTLAAALFAGFVINRLVVRQFQRATTRTPAGWDDAVAAELAKRVMFWSAVVGVWLSVAYWPMNPRWSLLITDAVVFVAILSIARAVAAVAVRLLGDLAPHVSSQMPVSGLMRNVVRFTILTIGLLVALRGVGVEITPMLAALGVGGLAAALALQEPLSNLFAGLLITIAGQVRIGDYIKMDGGPEGTVADLRWNATQLLTLAGNAVIVPNAKLVQAIVTNYHQPGMDSGFSVEFAVDPESDLAVIERVGVEVARGVVRDVPGGMPETDPSVRFLGFSDLGLRCAVNVRSRNFGDQALIRHELIKRLQAALVAAGVDISTLARPEGRRPKPDAR